MIKFDDNPLGRKPLCIACEEMLADAIDRNLGPADQTWFDTHIATCADCSQMVADAQRGAAWLELLKTPRPEPSAHLMERIIAQTSGAQTSGAISDNAPIVIGQPAFLPQPILPAAIPARSNLLAFRIPRLPNLSRAMFEPRLAMTAAMAFFSIALTLNLTGVRLDQLHASSLNPNNLKRTYYEANAQAVRYYDNLRVVRVMESRVDDLRDAAADTSRDDDRSPTAPKPESQREEKPAAPEAKPGQQPEQKSPEGGVSRREAPVKTRPHFQLTGQTIRRTETPNAALYAIKKEGGLA